MIRRFLLCALLVAPALSLGLAAPAAAQGRAPEPWQNLVTVYGWGANMSGLSSVDAITATVDVSFSEILDHLKMGAMLNYQGRNETLVAAFDMVYMKLGSDIATPNTGATLAEVRLKQWLFEADGGYRVTPWLDALVGLRVPIIETSITPDRDNPVITANSNSVYWVAPLVALRAEVPFGKKFTGIVRGDVGGFDLGGTNWTWQAAGYVNYKFGGVVSGTVGYRAISADYATGDAGQPGYFAYDISNFGPVFGVGFAF